MTKEDLELIISCSDASTILTDDGWSESYSVPLTITVKELRDLHSTLTAHEKLLNSNKHELQVMPKIDEYISWLQVFGYTVRINNHNIGDIHNITIERYEPLNKKKETFVKKHIDFLQLRLPSEAQKLFARFEELLKPFDRINFTA